jgi:predicted Rossmann fold flavoprotein
MKPTVLIIGGGAAGFFSACQLTAFEHPLNIIILEKDKEVLKKVRISGGGRCNVTHACFEPNQLVKYYPRGERELLGPFTKFQPKDTIKWFTSNGVPLKKEPDGRIFPETDSSETIIQCFLTICRKFNVKINVNCKVTSIKKMESKWEITAGSSTFSADYLMLTTGSNTTIWQMLSDLGHNIILPVPSLFTFKIINKELTALAGLSLSNTTIKIGGLNYFSEGPILITHWGLSGPAVLKLSAIAAFALNDLNYQFEIVVNWISQSYDKVLADLFQTKVNEGKKQIGNAVFNKIPYRCWLYLLHVSGIPSEQQWANITKTQLQHLTGHLTGHHLKVVGKSNNKDEFVTAGGISLKEINGKSFESKHHQNLYFAGEILNIDGLTGGFNFQAAWTGSYLASQAIISNLRNQISC